MLGMLDALNILDILAGEEDKYLSFRFLERN